MRKLLAATTILASAVSSATAQDVNWDRWFVGFDAGYIGRETISAVDGQFRYQGLSASLLAGKWWQIDMIALGFDLGAGIGGASTRTSWNDPPFWSGTLEFDEVFTSTARIKLGVPYGNLMPYLAAGPQYIHSKSKYTATFMGSYSESTEWETSFGMVAAVGAELLVSQNLAVKAEAGINLSLPNISTSAQHMGWSARIGANYYFD